MKERKHRPAGKVRQVMKGGGFEVGALRGQGHVPNEHAQRVMFWVSGSMISCVRMMCWGVVFTVSSKTAPTCLGGNSLDYYSCSSVENGDGGDSSLLLGTLFVLL